DVGVGGGVGRLGQAGELPAGGFGGPGVEVLEDGHPPVDELLRLVHVVEGGGRRLPRLDGGGRRLRRPAPAPLVARSPQRSLPSFAAQSGVDAPDFARWARSRAMRPARREWIASLERP